MTDSIMHREIYEQPAAFDRVLTGSREAIKSLVAEAKKRDIRYLVLAARGTSDNAATYGKYLFEIACGVPVALAAPSVHTLFEAKVDYRNALVIGVSQSGAGVDINEVLTQAKASGALTAAFTNTADSPLAGIADHVLLCHAGLEKAVAATKTYTTTLALFAALAAAWSGNTELQHGLEAIPTLAEKTLSTEAAVEPVAQTLIHAERMTTVARGLHYCTAIEAALKLAETSYTPTRAFSSADLLHGPIASVAGGTPVILFTPRGKTEIVMGEVAAKLTARGARVISFAAEGGVVPLIAPQTELLSPLVDIIPAQLLAYHLAIARGFNPDSPIGLTKVTVTR